MGRAGGRVQGCWQTPTHSPVQEMLQATKTNIAFCHLETFLWLSNDLSYSGQAVVRGKDGIRPCSFIQNLLAPCCLYQHPWGPRSQHLPKSCSISCNLPLTGPHLPKSQESCLHVSTITFSSAQYPPGIPVSQSPTGPPWSCSPCTHPPLGTLLLLSHVVPDTLVHLLCHNHARHNLLSGQP